MSSAPLSTTYEARLGEQSSSHRSVALRIPIKDATFLEPSLFHLSVQPYHPVWRNSRSALNSNQTQRKNSMTTYDKQRRIIIIIRRIRIRRRKTKMRSRKQIRGKMKKGNNHKTMIRKMRILRIARIIIITRRRRKMIIIRRRRKSEEEQKHKQKHNVKH